MSFLARVEVVLFALGFVSESVLDAEDDEEERRRRRGSDSFESSGEGSRCWRKVLACRRADSLRSGKELLTSGCRLRFGAMVSGPV